MITLSVRRQRRPLFAVLDFAKIEASPMAVATWTMEVDRVKHERRVE